MKTLTTILAIVIIGSCVASAELTVNTPRDFFKVFARMRLQAILTAFPELADEVKSGQIGPNNNPTGPFDSNNNQQNPLQGFFGQGQRRNQNNDMFQGFPSNLNDDQNNRHRQHNQALPNQEDIEINQDTDSLDRSPLNQNLPNQRSNELNKNQLPNESEEASLD